MKKLILVGLTFTVISTLGFAVERMTDAEVKQAIIKESISNYSGNCPCPYNIMKSGNRCGDRSAYAKPGGASPICYPSDVTPSMVRMYRRMHGE